VVTVKADAEICQASTVMLNSCRGNSYNSTAGNGIYQTRTRGD